MDISVNWLNAYLSPGSLDAARIEHLLTYAGFPIESAQPNADGSDTLLDVEVTSNRGDCLSHVGLAREIAAADPEQTLVMPDGFDANAAFNDAADVRSHAALRNEDHAGCPLFTAHIITGVTISQSPAWLRQRLEAIGMRPINNVVDITNLLTHELGQPCHVFDLDTIAKNQAGLPELIIRRARTDETLTLLDDRTITLKGGELIVADASGPISLAGVMGGASTEVTAKTTNVLFEAATWDPVAVRTAARRFNIRTDASYRFERTVDARTIMPAAARALSLIPDLAGGSLIPGTLHDGSPFATLAPITLRLRRLASILGIDVPAPRVEQVLSTLGISVSSQSDTAFACTPPAWRPDLTREIDLIEEIARIHSLDELPIHNTISIAPAPPQQSEQAVNTLTRSLTASGLDETVTFTFVSRAHAEPFMPAGAQRIEVNDARRKADPVLRPSVLPSLLICRKANQDARTSNPGGIRLFELSSIFCTDAKNSHTERRVLSILIDAAPEPGQKQPQANQHALRITRGCIESAVRALGGQSGFDALRITPTGTPSLPAYDSAASASVQLNGTHLGHIALLNKQTLSRFDIDTPLVAAELDLASLLALYPPRATVHSLPQFPAIERDVSLVVADSVRWQQITDLVDALDLPLLESRTFVGTYRGKQLAPNTKSLTLRLSFRDPAATLRHEQVDPQISAFVDKAKTQLHADVRTT